MVRLLFSALCALVLAPPLLAANPNPAQPKRSPPVGVVVEEVEKLGAAQRAGIKPGDVLLGWERSANPPPNPAPARGEFRTPFDAREVEIEQGPRGRIVLTTIRGGSTLSFDLSPGSWGMATRPVLEGETLVECNRAKDFADGGQPDKAATLWRELADDRSRSGDHASAAWFYYSAAMALGKAGRWADASLQYQDAVHEAELGGQRRIQSQLWDALGRIQLSSGNFEAAASTFLRALTIKEQLAPGSLDLARTLNSLGNVARARGDLIAAERFHRRALAIGQTLAPGSSAVSGSLNNLGIVSATRGDLGQSEKFFLDTLAIDREQEPGGLGEGLALLNLGNVALERGEEERADFYFRRALSIVEKVAPGTTHPAGIVYSLGRVARSRDDSVAAETFFRESLRILEQRFPESPGVALALQGLGGVLTTRGDYQSAEGPLQKAYAFYERRAPASDEAAYCLVELGKLARKRGDLRVAEELFLKALSIQMGTGSARQFEALHQLGLIRRQQGQLEEAAGYLARSVAKLDSRRGKLGGGEEGRSRFTAKYTDYYRDYVEVLFELGRHADAFMVLERSRARSLLSMLAERDLVFSADVSPELERERKLADLEYDRTQSKIRELNPKDKGKEIAELLNHLRDLSGTNAEIAERIKKASPKYASLQYPQPLDVVGAQAALDPGTLLLSYSVGKEKSFLFVVSSDLKRGPPLSVFTLPVGEKALRESVEAFRRLIEWNKPSPELLARSRSLYDTLLKPAEAQIGKNARLLILPDGPLHTLPWAALVRDVKAGQPQYLVEWKPIHTAVSATVYAELKKYRREGRNDPAIQVTAFGDPRYPGLVAKKTAAKRGDAAEEAEEDTYGDPQVNAVLRGGYKFQPLPRSRQEVETIASLYAPKSEAFLGEQATEERAKSIGKDVPLIHYACHAYVNERFPLDSALVFTIPEKPKEGQDNGLLQAWEIFEKVRIDADLVTLSACETGLGKEMGGEGLIGLTRAFQYAGARSVLASLWKVEDESTGELMKRFYRYLKSGKTKDEALRLAQIDLIHSPDFSQPIHWAAFELIGDWK